MGKFCVSFPSYEKENAVVLRERFDPGRGVDQIAYESVIQALGGAFVSDQRCPAMQSHAVSKKSFQLWFQVRSQLFHPGDEAKRGAKSTIGRVRLSVGSTPIAQELVAEKMFHAAILGQDRMGLGFKNLV